MILVYLDHDLAVHRPEHLIIPYEPTTGLFNSNSTEIQVVTRTTDKDVVLPRNFSAVNCKNYWKVLTKIIMVFRFFMLWWRHSDSHMIVHNDPIVAFGFQLLNKAFFRKDRKVVFRITHLIEESIMHSEVSVYVKFAALVRMFFRRFAVKYCACVFVTSQAMQAYFLTQFPKAKVTVLPATISFAKYEGDWNETPEDVAVDRVKTFIYVGTASDQRGFQEIFDFFDQNGINNAKLRVVFATPATEPVKLILSRISALGIPVELEVGIAEEEISRQISIADFGFANYPSTNPCYFNSPLKVLQYYALGVVPIISPNPHCMELALKVGSFRWIKPDNSVVFDESVAIDRQVIKRQLGKLRTQYDSSDVYSFYIEDVLS